MASQARYYAKPSEAQDFAAQLLLKAGLPQEHADLMAKCLVQADVRGVVGTLPIPQNPKPKSPAPHRIYWLTRARSPRTHTVSLVSSSTWAV